MGNRVMLDLYHQPQCETVSSEVQGRVSEKVWACSLEGSGAEDIAFYASGVQGPDRLWAQGFSLFVAEEILHFHSLNPKPLNPKPLYPISPKDLNPTPDKP